jgi:hypothetical protein
MGDVKTFVVRLFVPLEPEPRADGASLRGLVEEVGTGGRATFAGGQELLAFLAAAKADEAEAPGRSSS